MFHRSERLLLRPIWPEDWQIVLEGIADEAIVRNLASAPWPYGEGDARAFTRLSIEPLFPRFLITRAHDAALVGCIGIDPTSAFEDGVEIGYWIARPHWGNGYATEAGRAVISIAGVLGYRRMSAMHFTDNPASGKVLQKIGFSSTGVRSLRYSEGRGEEAVVAEYSLSLVDAIPPIRDAA